MKNILLTALKALLFPFAWCRQVILDASDSFLDYDPVGYCDCKKFMSQKRTYQPAKVPQPFGERSDYSDFAISYSVGHHS